MAIQCLTCICVSHLKNLRFTLQPPIQSENYDNPTSEVPSCPSEYRRTEDSERESDFPNTDESNREEVSGNLVGTHNRRLSNRPGQFHNQLLKTNEQWTVEETERMLQYMAKVFMIQFPLYSGPKQAGQRNEEVSYMSQNV